MITGYHPGAGNKDGSIRVTAQEARVGRPVATHKPFAADKELQPPTLLPRSLNRPMSPGPTIPYLKLQQGISRNIALKVKVTDDVCVCRQTWHLYHHQVEKGVSTIGVSYNLKLWPYYI